MNLFQYFKIFKTLRSLRAINPRAEWVATVRQRLALATGYDGGRMLHRPSFRFVPVMSIVLIVVLGVSVGTTFASKDAMPTDSLYQFKLLGERVQGIFIFGEHKQAEFALMLAERRLEEARHLAEFETQQLVQGISESEQESVSEPRVAVAVSSADNVAMPVLVATIERFEKQLENAQLHIEKSKQSQRNETKIINIAEKLEKLQEKQNELQSRLSIHIPELAHALENAQIISFNVQQNVDKVIITLGTVPLNASSSTTTVVALPGNAQDRALKAIERAEQKVAIVEEKLARFSNISIPAISDDEDHESFIPRGLLKNFGFGVGVGVVYAKDNDDKGKNKKTEVRVKFIQSNKFSEQFIEARKKIAEAKEKLVEARSRYGAGQYGEAYEKAIEAFKKAVEAEGKINKGIWSSLPDSTAPSISNVLVQDIGTSSATITWNTNEVADSNVLYGTSSNYGLLVSQGSFVGAHSIVLNGLLPGTQYHFQVVSKDIAGNVATSSNYTFMSASTVPSDTIAPIITSVTVNAIGTSSATIGWVTNELATSRVEYGNNVSYGLAASTSGFATSHSILLSGLNASSTYHFKVVSRDAAGNIAQSSDFTFSTTALPDTSAPIISALNVLGLSTSSATIVWSTNEPATSLVEYGTSSSYGLTASSSSFTTAHSLPLTGLADGTIYHYRVSSRDAANNLAVSSDASFTTATTSQPQ